MIATNLTPICCVYNKKIVKNDSQRRTQRPYKFGKMQRSTRIVYTNQFNSKQIIQILETVVIDYFSTHLTFHNILIFFKNNFRWRLIFEHSWKIWKCRLHYQKSWKGINVFKSNSQIMKNTKYYEISTIYECVSKIIDDYCL